MTQLGRRSRLAAYRAAQLLALLAMLGALTASSAHAATSGAAGGSAVEHASGAPAADGSGGSLEAAASKASQLGRKVAMSLIALGLAVGAVVLVFRRNFKEAATVLVVGLLAVLLATPVGVSVLRDTVNSLFG